jgi:hypothetical protein
MGTVAEDRAYADQFEGQISATLGGVLVRGATFRLDTKEATDFIVYNVQHGPRRGQPVGAIGARVRRPGCYYGRTYRSPTHWGLQFTIRTWRSSLVETELAKIRRGFGDWYIYGHIEQRLLRHWMVLDLEIFRANERKSRVIREEIDNRDGTFFSAYDVRTFPDAILVAVSDTMAVALEYGVDAVEPLPDEAPPRNLVEPPDLQALVRAHGGYHLIPQPAWAEFDRAMARWKDRVRNGEATEERKT